MGSPLGPGYSELLARCKSPSCGGLAPSDDEALDPAVRAWETLGMKSRHPTYLRRVAARIAGAWVSSISLLLASSAWATPVAIPSKDPPSAKIEKDGVTKEKAQVRIRGCGFCGPRNFYRHFCFRDNGHLGARDGSRLSWGQGTGQRTS